MKLCFRKKRGLCTLLLILCCGSGWSLNQRHGRSAQQADQFCLREDFHQLLRLPMKNVCCKYDDVDRSNAEGLDCEGARQNSETNERQMDKIVTSTDKSVVSQLESAIPINSINLEKNEENETLRVNDEGDLPNFVEHLTQESLLATKQNETDNGTASILNDSIIQDKEAMPSFDEWKKIRLEQEMQEPSLSSPKEPEHREGVVKPAKRGRRNYASIECGAKLVAANAGAEGASKVLLEAKDEYMLNPCSSLQQGGMWFIVELCESIHPTHIELANFELYSSTGKEFIVYMSDHYQSREWTQVGRYEMAHLKSVQTFPLDAPGFGKVIKVEFVSIYENSQYYCPLSLVRVFGTSMVDDYEEKNAEDTLLAPEAPEEDVEPTPASKKDASSTKTATGSSAGTTTTSTASSGVAIGPPGRTTTVLVDENMMSRAKQAMFNIINSVSKVVSGTRNDANCSDCATNESDVDTSFFAQQFDNCFELTNLSGFEGHLWPSMKCRFAEVTNLQRSCRPLPPAASSIQIEPSPLKVIPNLSPPISTSASSLTAVPSITMTVEMISPTTVAEAEKSEESKTRTSLPIKLVTELKDETPQAQSELEAVLRPNVKIAPVSQINPIPASHHQPTMPVPQGKTANQNANQPTKENLFSRFENRIRKLELHMNLSGTYLEELSKRYRNQMEEMQAAFNKTVAALNMEAKKGLERDQNQQQALAVLQERLTAVTESLRRLEIESDSLWWRLLLVYLGLLVVSIAIFIVIFHLIFRRTITTYVWSEHMERRVLELLEQERRSRRNETPTRKNIVHKPEDDKNTKFENSFSLEEGKHEEKLDDEVVKKEDETEPEVKSEAEIDPVKEVKIETPEGYSMDQTQPDTFQKDCHQKKSSCQEELLNAQDLKINSAFVNYASENDDFPLQKCTKCVISCCTHALLRH